MATSTTRAGTTRTTTAGSTAAATAATTDSGGYGGGYGGGYAGGSQGTGSSSYGGGPQGSLRLKIKPREGQVYVDGFFVGTVDDFDGTFQKLGIDAGGHRIEIKAPGHETISFEVLITPNETVTYKGELPQIQ